MAHNSQLVRAKENPHVKPQIQFNPIWFEIRVKIIKIYHECEGRIGKSVPRITDWHHEACRVMTNGDHEGQIFLSYPYANN